jgi:hypothetical protein
MTRDLFDVNTREATIAFLRSMYNFKSVVEDVDAKWNPGKEALCRDLFNAVQGLPALTSRMRTSDQRSGSSAVLSSIDRLANPCLGKATGSINIQLWYVHSSDGFACVVS